MLAGKPVDLKTVEQELVELSESYRLRKKELTNAYQRRRLPLTRLRQCLKEEEDPQMKLPGLTEKEMQKAEGKESSIPSGRSPQAEPVEERKPA